jgi:hypothetical protein
MRKLAIAVVLLGSLSTLAGCSSIEEPTSQGGPAKTAPSGPRVASNDIAPSRLFAIPSRDVVMKSETLSLPGAPNGQIVFEPAAEMVHSTDMLRIVQPGSQPVTLHLPVDSTDGEAYLYLGVHSSDSQVVERALRGIHVFDPNGVQLNVRAPIENADKNSGGKPMSAIPLNGLPVGDYTVVLEASASKAGLTADVRQPRTAIEMHLLPSTSRHLLGNDSSITTSVVEGGMPVTGAQVTGWLTLPNRSDGPALSFRDVGGGKYVAALDVLGPGDAVGMYTVHVHAEGTSAAGAPFVRSALTAVHFGVPTGRIAGVGATRLVTDDAGKVAAFEVDVAVESAAVDRYEVHGVLAATGRDGIEHPVAHAYTNVGLDVGTHTVVLHVDAGHVRLSGLDGALSLRHLTLYSTQSQTLMQRIGYGQGAVFPVVARANLRPLDRFTPAIQEAVLAGELVGD